MPLVGLQFGPRRLTWAEAKAEYEAGTFPYPTPLLRAMAEDRSDTVPSASVLVGCLRQFQLKAHADYYEKPADLLPSIFGTAFHLLMERHTEVDPGRRGEIRDYLPGGRVDYYPDTSPGPRHRELKLAARVALGLPGYESVEVRGTCDFLHEGVLVRDWKSKKYLAQDHTPPRANVRQVNVYNWLAAKNGLTPAPVWELVYVSQSWLSRFSDRMDDLARVEEWVTSRVHEWALHEAQGELVPPLPELFRRDEKGRVPAPCGYCPVREQCLAAWREDQELPF